MSLYLGIDTGGTYTDSVIYDSKDKKVLSLSKSLTTHENLRIGIENSIKKLDKVLISKIEEVHLSTTLATNACVEGKFPNVRLVFINTYRKVVEEVGLNYGLSENDDIMFLDIREEQVLDETFLQVLIDEILKDSQLYAGIGLVQFNALEESARYEKILFGLLETKTTLPLMCGHHLFNELNVIRRGASIILNLKLIPVIENFVRDIKTVLLSYGFSKEVKIVRSDGSLMNEQTSLLGPIETILCGPASSVIGGIKLSNLEESIIIDMGGTTTDISLVRKGIPLRVKKGISIGNWKTMVKGVYIHTVALGGDTRVFMKNNVCDLDVKKIIPLCVGCKKYPFIVDEIRSLIENEEQSSVPLFEYLLIQKEITNFAAFSDSDIAMYTALKERPLNIRQLGEKISIDTHAIKLERLINNGIVQRIGLTATDIMHIKKDFNSFDVTGSKLAVQWFAECLNRYGHTSFTEETLCDYIYDLVSKKLYSVLVEILSEYGNVPFSHAFVDASWDIKNNNGDAFFEPTFSTNATLLGIGAPIHLFLPKVAKTMNTSYFVPEHHSIANAIGSAVSRITGEYKTEIVCRDDEYHVFCADKTYVEKEYEDALDIAKKNSEREAVYQMQRRGFLGESFSVHYDIVEDSYTERGTVIAHLGTTVTAIIE